MSQIRRHDIDVDNARTRDGKLARIIERNLADIAEYPGMLESVQRKALLRTKFRLSFDPSGESSETRSTITLSGSAGSAFFASAKVSAGEFDFTVRDQVRLTATGPTIEHNASVWLDSLWACLVARDELSADELCTFPVDTLRTTDATFPPYVYSWTAAVSSFFLREQDALSKLNKSIAETDPSSVDPELLDTALMIYYPQMKVLHHLATQNEVEFNKALKQAVELHQEFWTSNGQRSTDPDGFFSLPLTAMAATAHDIGITVDVQTDYLPHDFVTGAGFDASTRGR